MFKGESKYGFEVDGNRRITYILASLVGAVCFGLIAGAMVPVELVLIFVASFVFLLLFVVFFSFYLLAGAICVISLTLLFDKTARIALEGLPDITPGRVGALLIILIFFTKIYFNRQMIESMGKTEFFMLIFILVCFFSSVASGTFSNAFPETLLGYSLPFFYFFFAKHLMDSEKKIGAFIVFVFGLGIYVSVIGIFEHFHLYRFIFPLIPSIDSGYREFGYITGHLGLPAATGTLLSFSFICGLYISKNTKMPFSPLVWFLEAMIVVAIFFCYTRAVYVGLVSALFILFLFSRSLRKVSAVLLLALSLLVVARWTVVKGYDRATGGVGDPAHLYHRIAVAKISLSIFVDHPLFGTGLGTFVKQRDKYLRDLGITLSEHAQDAGQHNSYLGILSELGLLGFIPLIAIYFLILKRSINIFFRKALNPNSREIISISLASFTVYFINASFIEMRYFEIVNDLFFIFLAIPSTAFITNYIKADGLPAGNRYYTLANSAAVSGSFQSQQLNKSAY